MAATECNLDGRSRVGDQGAIAGAGVGKKFSRSRFGQTEMLCPHLVLTGSRGVGMASIFVSLECSGLP